MRDSRNIFTRAEIITGLVLSLAPFVLFPVCDSLRPDGSHMGCYFSALFITSVGILILLLSLVSELTRKFRTVAFIIGIMASVSCWLIPNRIITLEPCGLCMNPEHACRASTMPAVGIIIVAIVVVCVAGLILEFVKGGRNA